MREELIGIRTCDPRYCPALFWIVLPLCLPFCLIIWLNVVLYGD
ncbi:hypothetical protein H206_05280 [Candidatus Electrothrix aarhusensis]|uniref:Uncharacterized protein n=1 Tax=Candidatus Electrothrix aarhusensis TaxID=1859131 RepID=A0A444J555_9BACT|nr:hypothetical protein H206_05280 [Candidatus Electrothrix aarhusensis]